MPDTLTYQGTEYAVTAIDGSALFDPAEHGIAAGVLGSGCWRGHMCAYAVADTALTLRRHLVGEDPDTDVVPTLRGAEPVRSRDDARYEDAFAFDDLDVRVEFTGRLLVGADPEPVGYLNMGFWPAWFYGRVLEVAFDRGRLTSVVDRSAELATVREHLGGVEHRPSAGEELAEWIGRTFSLSFEYSWPTVR